MEKNYRSVMWDGDEFEKARWYLDISGNTYDHRTELKKERFRWDPERQVWWKWILNNEVPVDVQRKHKTDYISKLHSKGITYPLCQPKCVKNGCNGPKKSECELCSDCQYKENIKGGLRCNGWMSNKCKYSPQLTIKGAMCCQGCYNDSVIWAKTNPFANDNS